MTTPSRPELYDLLPECRRDGHGNCDRIVVFDGAMLRCTCYCHERPVRSRHADCES